MCTTLFHCRHLLFTWKTHCGLKFHFGQIDQSEICTEVNFTSPKLVWTLIIKLPYTEVKFYPEVKSQASLSSLRVSCKRAQNAHQHWWHHLFNKKIRFLKLFSTFVTNNSIIYVKILPDDVLTPNRISIVFLSLSWNCSFSLNWGSFYL